MVIRVFQAFILVIAFIGWIIYQVIFRKKRFSEISNDVMAIAFFLTVWIGITYWLFK